VLTLETLADVRALVEKHLPAEYRSKFTWRQFAGLLKRAAEGQQDVSEVSIALRICEANGFSPDILKIERRDRAARRNEKPQPASAPGRGRVSRTTQASAPGSGSVQ
jgi:hypothetical protein